MPSTRGGFETLDQLKARSEAHAQCTSDLGAHPYSRLQSQATSPEPGAMAPGFIPSRFPDNTDDWGDLIPSTNPKEEEEEKVADKEEEEEQEFDSEEEELE